MIKLGLLVLLGLAAGVLLFAGPTKTNHAAADGSTAGSVATVPLLSCPNVDGSSDNGVRVGDILAVVGAYFKDWGTPNYYYLYDLVNPYNPETHTGGQERVDDILNVVNHYFQTCPAVDTQVAQATRWAIQNVPMTPGGTGAGGQTLAQLGYVQGSSDVPGQGVHYVKYANWDGTFDPQAPEGLVYTDGRLGAELYVVDGTNSSIGWIEDPEPNVGPPTYGPPATAGSCEDGIDNGSDGLMDAADPDCGSGASPAHAGPSDVNIDTLCTTSPCSWSGTEGWHLHYRLCTVHIDTPYAIAIPMPPGSGTSDCLADQNATPCSGPGCPGTYIYQERVGWMGHLWSFLPNDNQVPDVNSTSNGRFADCYPDTEGWTAYNCPR
jgi:hypothetical protein